MKVSIIIPVYNQMLMTSECLRDLYKTYGVDFEVIVVDDGSKEPIYNLVPKMFPDVRIFKNEINSGFAKTVNKGISESTGDVVCLLNNDVNINNPGWLKIMTAALDEFDLVAPAGSKMDKQWNYIPGEAKSNKEKFSYLPFWCIMMRREVLDAVGPVPEDFAAGFFEDVLFCYRAKKAGFKMGIVEGTGVVHKYHSTFKAEGYNLAEEYNKKRKIFLEIIKKEG